MTFYQFISYEPTPEDPKQIGVVTYKLYGKIKVRFKIIPTKDGTSWFAIAASYKIGKDNVGKDRYIPAFSLNEVDELDELLLAIKKHVVDAMKQTSQPKAPEPQWTPNLYTGTTPGTATDFPAPEDQNLPF